MLNTVFLSKEEFKNNLDSNLFDIYNEIFLLISNFYTYYVLHLFYFNFNSNNNKDFNIIKNYYINNFPKTLLKSEQVFENFEKNIPKSQELLTHYIDLTLNFSKLKCFSILLIDLMKYKTISNLLNIIINHVLYTEFNKNIIYDKNKYKTNNNITNNTTADDSISFNQNSQKSFLPPINKYKYKYTLVVDLDETLIHSFKINNKEIYVIRPYVFEFLNELYQKYEIIVFTAGTKDYADKILNEIDKDNKFIQYRLYREHLSYDDYDYSVIKDLSKLGRDLTKTIFIDDCQENFALQPDNGLLIKTWNGDFVDKNLLDIKNLLTSLYYLDFYGDIREIIKKINKNINKNEDNPYKNVNICEYA
jgi:Dullard-like phosphatase family protein